MSDVSIPSGAVELQGVLEVPARARGIVVFSHGSGSGRFSTRNRYVAGELRKAGIATLLLDLLTEEEDQVYENRFDIPLLTERLGDAVRFAAQRNPGCSLDIAHGAGTCKSSPGTRPKWRRLRVTSVRPRWSAVARPASSISDTSRPAGST